MLNVNQITSELARLPDQALQQYAMLHKSDPYVVSLALSEANRRKQMRAGAQPQQQQQQPPVVEQAVASMGQQQLPEEVGIGALPAQNIQHMADGGIVGYSDNDQQLVYNNEPALRMADGGMVSFSDNKDQPVRKDMPSTDDAPENENPLSLGAFLRRWKASGQPLLPYLGVETTRTPQYYPESTISGKGPSNKELEQMYGLAAAAPSAPSAPFAPSAPSAPSNRPATPSPTQATREAAPPPATQQGLGALSEALKPLQEVLKPYAAETAPDREAEMAARDRYLGKGPFEDQMKRLEKMDELAALEREDAKNMALMKAGFAMLSSKSPYGMVGIGEGAQAGLADYGAALKDLKAAEREREKTRMAIEQAKYGIKADNWDKATAAIEKAKDRQAASNDRLTAALGSYAGHVVSGEYGLKREEMQGKTQQAIAQMQERGQMARANALPGEARLAMLLGTGTTDEERLVSGLKRLQDVQSGKMNLATAYADYLKAFAGKDTLTPPMSFANYAAQFGATLPR